MFSQVLVMILNSGVGVAGHHSNWTCFSVKVKQKVYKRRRKSLLREDEKLSKHRKPHCMLLCTDGKRTEECIRGISN